MNGPQLKAWRQSEDLSLREVSEILNGDPTVSTLSRWENSTEEIPSLVSERLLNSTLITLPLGELHQLLDYCRATQQPFHTVLAQALREHLSRTQSANITAHATTTEAAPAIHEPAPPTDSQAMLCSACELLAAVAEQTDIKVTVCHTGRMQLYDYGSEEFEADQMEPHRAAETLKSALEARPDGWVWPRPNALRELPPPSSSASTKDSIGG